MDMIKEQKQTNKHIYTYIYIKAKGNMSEKQRPCVPVECERE